MKELTAIEMELVAGAGEISQNVNDQINRLVNESVLPIYASVRAKVTQALGTPSSQPTTSETNLQQDYTYPLPAKPTFSEMMQMALQ